MKREPVDSSMIASVGYDPDTEELEVEFNSGKVYLYRNVPKEEYEGLMAAGSKGQYMLGCIIDMYPTSQLRRRSRY